MSAPALQWDLSRSVDSTFAVSQGIIRAATTDNVQILALLACERFGATLAVCQDTCRKVEFEVIKVQTPSKRVLKFLGATVGYSRDDCTSQLVRSQAGVQFIGLAAALISSVTTYEGATILFGMLKESASDKTLLPPVSHLRDLLTSLEHRCVRFGFADQVQGWNRLFDKVLVRSVNGSSAWELSSSYRIYMLNEIPGPKFLGHLVDAFRQLNRVGDASSVSLKVTRGAAWLAAFTKWCIGMPPSIYLEDGTVLLEEPASRVVLTLYTSGYTAEGGEITVHRSINALSEVITGTDHLYHIFNWSGMVTVEGYGQWLLRKLRIGNGTTVLHSILPYAMKQLVTRLYLSNRAEHDFPEWREYALPSPPAKKAVGGNSPYPWPSDHVVSSTLTRMLASTESLYLPDDTSDTRLADLPLLKQSLDDVGAKCLCVGCYKLEEIRGLSPISRLTCDKAKIIEKIGIFALHVLIVSLFDFSENLLLYTYKARGGSKLLEAVGLILDKGTMATCSINDLLKVALTLVGHTVGDMGSNNVEVNGRPPDDLSGNNHWVISCFRGQTVYPMIFETQTPYEDGFMSLCWTAGLLRFEGENYSQGRGINNTLYMPNMISYEPVTSAGNLLPSRSLEWRVTPGESNLNIVLSIQGLGEPLHEHAVRSPIQILIGLTSTLILHGCAHDPHAAMAEPDPFCVWSMARYGTKLLCLDTNSDKVFIDPQVIEVVPVDGNDSLRLHALASYAYYSPIILRKDACLACCLAAARRIGAKVIIC